MNNLKPLPNSQRQLEKQAIQPNTPPAEFGSPSINRGNETAFDNTDQKPFTSRFCICMNVCVIKSRCAHSSAYRQTLQ